MKLLTLQEWKDQGKPKSRKSSGIRVVSCCGECGKEIVRLPSSLRKKNTNRLFCSSSCSTRYRNLHDGVPAQRPGWGERWVRVCERNGTLPVGDKNPRFGAVLSKETKEKISKNKSEPTRSHAKFRDHTRPNGEIVRLQGHWEAEFAKWLDKSGIEYEPHPKVKFDYEDVNGQVRNYSPDFWIKSWNCYVDPKNSFCLRQDRHKLQAVRERHNINLLVLTFKLLKAYNCDIKGN